MANPIRFGNYLLLRPINVGGMAEVFKAKTFGVEGFERLVAVKRILPSIAKDTEFVSMFIDEAKIAVQLNHANIAQVFELGRAKGSYFIAMEYVAGKDVRAIFDRLGEQGEKLPIGLACEIIMKVCEGLDYAHRKRGGDGAELNLVHRDVSPQNILISFDGEVKIIDFGIAKVFGRASKTQSGILKGKFGYMSPEQVRGLPLDRRSDIFTVGICFYELLTGRRLFLGQSDFSTLEKVRNVEVVPPSVHLPHIDRELEEIVLKALARDVEERFATAMDLHHAIQEYAFRSGHAVTRQALSDFMHRLFPAELAKESEDAFEVSGLEELDSSFLEETPVELPAPRPEGIERVVEERPAPPAQHLTPPRIDAAPPARALTPSPWGNPSAPAAGAQPPEGGWWRSPAAGALLPQRPTLRNPAQGAPLGARPPLALGGGGMGTSAARAYSTWEEEDATTHIYDRADSGLHAWPAPQSDAFRYPHLPSPTPPRAHDLRDEGFHPQSFTGFAGPPQKEVEPYLSEPFLPTTEWGKGSDFALPPLPPPSATPSPYSHSAPDAFLFDSPEAARRHDFRPPATPSPWQTPGAELSSRSMQRGLPSPFDAPAPQEKQPSIRPSVTTEATTRTGRPYERLRPPRWMWIAGFATLSLMIGLFAWLAFPSKESGTIHLVTIPEDPQVTLDGVPVAAATSPFVLNQIEGGLVHILQVSKPGYRKWSMQIQLQPGQTLTLPIVRLKPDGAEGEKGAETTGANASLIVTTEPTGAKVYIDGELQNQRTPARFASLRAGTHSLRVEAGGEYQPWQGTVELKAGQNLDLAKITLPKRVLWLQVQSNPSEAEVFLVKGIERRSLGLTPLKTELTLGEGAWSLELRKKGFETLQQALQLHEGEKEKLLDLELHRSRGGRSAAPAPRAVAAAPAPRAKSSSAQDDEESEGNGSHGTLRINSKPWSEVYVDGAKIGNTPQLNIPLAPGSHEVKLVNGEFNLSRSFKVKIAAGKVTTKIVDRASENE